MHLYTARTDDDGLEHLVAAMEDDERFELVGSGRTGSEISRAVRAGQLDALLFPLGVADLVRTVSRSVDTMHETAPALIMAAEALSAPLTVWATLSGFHAVVSTAETSANTLDRIARTAAGEHRLVEEPLVRALELTPGLLARNLIVEDPRDRHVADLVGAGLTDDDIARTMDLSIQTVRNRIEHLLSANGLRHRTQLAVMRAATLRVPDFS